MPIIPVNYTPTRQVEHIHQLIFNQFSPHAFAIANFDNHPILTYKGHNCHINTLMVHLTLKNQLLRFSHQTKPPYFIAVSKEETGSSASLVVYGAESMPLLEYTGVDLKGQIAAYSTASDRSNQQLIAHAIFLPNFSTIYANTNRHTSVLLEGDAELCNHLLLCSMMIEHLLELPHKEGRE